MSTTPNPKGVDNRSLERLAAEIGKPVEEVVRVATVASLMKYVGETLREIPGDRLGVTTRLLMEAFENERLSRLAGAIDAGPSHLDDGSGHGLPLTPPGLNGDAWSRRHEKYAAQRRVCNSSAPIDTPPCAGDTEPLAIIGPGGDFCREYKPAPAAKREGWLGRWLDIFG